MRRPVPLLLAALAAAGCVGGTSPLAPDTVDPGYAEGGGVFNTGTRLTVSAQAFEQAGKVAVCAAWAGDGVTAPTVPHLNDVLDTGVLQLGGRNVLQGFAAFPRAPSRDALSGAPAGCVVTGRAWRAGDAGAAPRIRFGRIVLERDEEDGVVLWFRGD